MERIFETVLKRMHKENGLKITEGAHLLPRCNALLNVKDGRTGKVMQFEYNVDGGIPIIRGKEWRNFIHPYEKDAVVTLSTPDGSNYEIVVR